MSVRELVCVRDSWFMCKAAGAYVLVCEREHQHVCERVLVQMCVLESLCMCDKACACVRACACAREQVPV